MNPNNVVEEREDSNASIILPIQDQAYDSLGSAPTCDFDANTVANVNANSNKGHELNAPSQFLYLSASREPEKLADNKLKHAQTYETTSYLELSLDGSVVSENEDGLPHEESNNLSFVTEHESIPACGDEFNEYAQEFDAAETSSCFSQLLRKNPNDCMEDETTLQSDVPCIEEKHKRQNEEDMVLNTVEETSLDSGLGSVDSAYGNSGEDDHTSYLSSSPTSPEGLLIVFYFELV